MKKRLYSAVLIGFAAIFLASSCKKDKTPAATSFDITLKFGTPNQQAHVVVYGSEADYNTNSNPLMSGVTDQNGTYAIPLSQITKNTTYYLDIYTDDGLYNNWIGSLPRTFTYTDDNKGIYCGVAQPTDSFVRRLYLNITGTQTTWKVIDASDGNLHNSIWNNLTPEQQYIKMVLRKDKTGVIMSKDASGSVNSLDVSFTPNGQSVLGTPQAPLYALLDRHPLCQLDTLLVSLGQSPYRYTLVKE